MKTAILSIFIFCCGYLQAQTTAPKYSNEFLRFGAGARAAAMGGVQVGIADDVTAGYWNPAGLSFGKKAPELGLMHSEYFAGIAKYDYGAFSTAIPGDRHVGLSFIRFAIDDIPNTLNFKDGNTFNYDKITSFSVADMALMLSVSQKLGEKFSLGGNVKIINRIIGDFGTGWGFGLDVAAKYKSEAFQAGLVIKDLTTTFNAWTYNTELFEQTFAQTGNEIPQNSIELTLPSLHIGAGYTLFSESKFNLLASADLIMHFDGKRNDALNLGPASITGRVGLEASLAKRIYVRAGAQDFQSIPNIDGKKVFGLVPSMGVGVNIFDVAWIDYALSVSRFKDESKRLMTHQFSLRFNLEKVLPKKSLF